MPIWIARWYIEIVQYSSTIHQIVRYFRWQFRNETRHNVAPSLLPLVQMKGLDRHFRGLLRSKARPLMPFFTS